MRILGIDYGDSRIGVAMSDIMGWTANAVETINWSGDINKPLDRIVQLITQNGVEKVIVGFPKNMNGTIGPRGEKTIEFIDLLSKKTTADIIKWDERLSTVAASRVMHDVGMKTKKKKQVVDQIAAVFILQGYLDSVSK